MFSGLVSLTSLRLDSNSIVSLGAGVFDGLAFLATLNLGNNLIDSGKPDEMGIYICYLRGLIEARLFSQWKPMYFLESPALETSASLGIR